MLDDRGESGYRFPTAKVIIKNDLNKYFILKNVNRKIFFYLVFFNKIYLVISQKSATFAVGITEGVTQCHQCCSQANTKKGVTFVTPSAKQ